MREYQQIKRFFERLKSKCFEEVFVDKNIVLWTYVIENNNSE